jgi:hypothetical protein
MTAVDINEHEMVGAGRCWVRIGLEQLFEVGFQAAISLEEYL